MHATPSLSRLSIARGCVCARVYALACACVCACVCMRVRVCAHVCARPQKPRRDSSDIRGGVRARTVYCSCPPDLQQVKLKKRAKKHSSQTRMNTRVGESDDLVV